MTVVVQHRAGRGRELLTDDAEDISVTGLFVHSDEPYTVGTAVGLSLVVPGGTIEATGRVVRVGVGASGRTGMGVMFTALDLRALRCIEELVAAAESR